jgi:hypothetical protein
VFDSAQQTKSLLEIIDRNWPKLLAQHVVSEAEVEPTFQLAFEMARTGLTCLFEINGKAMFLGGTVIDGRARSDGSRSCTSMDVVRTANHLLSRVHDLVESVAKNADSLADAIERKSGARPGELDLRVINLPEVKLREEKSGVCIGWNGSPFVLEPSPTE